MSRDGESDSDAPRMGRPPSLTPELQAEIVKCIKAGNYAETAALAAGIDESTYYRWLRLGKGETAREPYAEFYQAVTRARAEAEVALVNRVRKGDGVGMSNGRAKGAQFLLERTRGKKFAPRVSLKVEEELESLLDVVERVCSAKDCGCYEALLEALAARDGGAEVGGAPPGSESDQDVVH